MNEKSEKGKLGDRQSVNELLSVEAIHRSIGSPEGHLFNFTPKFKKFRSLNKRKIINDPVYGFITIPTDLIFDLMEHVWFQRLGRIKQLGLTHLVYPGAQHSRLSHALGAMHLMQQALEVLSSKGAEVTRDEAEAVTVCILLHDLGHGPFSHTLEKVLIPRVSHEELTLLMLRKLNDECGGRLNQAIEIFIGEHPKKFLHQLVSSQLDMDRLDYLNRDSFFTGVAEGVIGYDRIIKMLSVHNNDLVVEAKGIYSIEKFLISRRLMYWQVYLHKTVLAAEEMLVQIVRRARKISKERMLLCLPALSWFLTHEVQANDFAWNPELLHRFAGLDDADILSAIKQWRTDEDAVLSFLCRSLLDRKLLKIELQNQPFSEERVKELKRKLALVHGLNAEAAERLVISETTTNHAYNPRAEMIRILFRNGTVKDVSETSDLFNMDVLKQPVTKYYLCYPREVLQ
jgi:hypothetical protein